MTMNIHQRINAVQLEVREVKKVRQNDHFKYKFIGHDDVTTALRDAKAKHGIVTEITMNQCLREDSVVRVEVLVSYVNMDEPDNRVTVAAWGESFAEPTRSNPTPRPSDLQIGKALSYAVKLAELKNFALIGDSTPDSETAHSDEPAAPAQQKTAVDEGEFNELLAVCSAVTAQADLDALNASINRVAKLLTKEQYAALAVEHGKAKARITAAAAA
jgi:hypothetical protein